MLQQVEKLGQLPAACQVEPAVSSSRSSSTTSVQPSRVRWYSALQPTAPPPMTTSRAWLFMEHAAATGGARHAPAGAPDSTLHPRARRVIEGPHRDPRGHALAGDLHLVSPRGDPLGAHRRAAVGDVAEAERRTDGTTEQPRGDPSDQHVVAPDRLVVIQLAIGALERNRHESPPHALRAPLAERLEADEAPGLVPGDGKLQAGLERCVLVADVVAPVPIRLFHAQTVQGMVAREAQSEGLTGADDHVVYGLRELRGNVQLVAELSDVRDPAGPYPRVAQIDDPGCGERKRSSGTVRIRARRQQLAAARPHETEHRIRRGRVECDGARVLRNAAAQPGEIARVRRARGDDEECVLGLARDREVGLDAAALIQPLRIDDPADRHVDVIGADPSEHHRRIAAPEHELGERGLIEQAHPFTYRLVLPGRLSEPVLAAVAVFVTRLSPRGREPVRALEARHLSEAGPRCSEAVVQGRLAHPARGLGLPERPMHRIEQAERLDRALAQVALVALERRAAANIDVPQVRGRMPVDDPVRQYLARSTGGLDADRIE